MNVLMELGKAVQSTAVETGLDFEVTLKISTKETPSNYTFLPKIKGIKLDLHLQVRDGHEVANITADSLDQLQYMILELCPEKIRNAYAEDNEKLRTLAMEHRRKNLIKMLRSKRND